ncbi:Prephenate dehydrogenase [Ascobolus immersus RN42]|uniref:Prephenate dehydrogenase [NADP(+)] n=1 Tax=Ascobolus immersus RN42 TaxID=1160509 RepID=A0A3N4IMP6_ASCIM|nr:Prephenate dehydrogenase [Ascobolus immersus RN42]
MAPIQPTTAISVGIIGMGDMGRMYANGISRAGWMVNACDREELYESLSNDYKEAPNVRIFQNGHLVSRISDYIIYCVEAENIAKVVSAYGPSTKVGAIVGGQTSCKAPEIAAFEKFLPSDVEIVSCHSLHGPKVDPVGQPLVLIKHRASDKSYELVESILGCFGSKFVHLSAVEHDRITADTQAVLHAAFLSMGSAWTANSQFPWEVPRWSGGIENVKMNVTLRIYSNKWHVYAGLAILNPAAQKQIKQYATSVTELFKLILCGERDEFRKRITEAGMAVFGGKKEGDELLLKDELLDKFSLSGVPKQERKPNSHLSLLAMVDCWHKCGIVPYDHIICSTPLFRLWLGATEYLFRQPELLNECIEFALSDKQFRTDDLEFTFAARAWSDAVQLGDFNAYRKRFEAPQKYFAPRFPEATRLGNEMIHTILERTKILDGAKVQNEGHE